MSDIYEIRQELAKMRQSQNTIDNLNKSFGELGRQLDSFPSKMSPLTSSFDSLAQVSRVIESIQMAKYLTGVANSALTTTKAITGVYAAQKSLSAVGGSLLGVMGGPLGLAITIGTVAASFLSLSDSASEARKALTENVNSLEDVLERYKNFGAVQRRSFEFEYQVKLKEDQDGMNRSLDRLSSRIASKFLRHPDEIITNASQEEQVTQSLSNIKNAVSNDALSDSEIQSVVQSNLDEIAKTGLFTEEQLQRNQDISLELINHVRSYGQHNKILSTINNLSKELSSSTKTGTEGNEELGKVYLKQLNYYESQLETKKRVIRVRKARDTVI